MRDWYDTLVSQYATSPTLVQLIRSFDEAVSPDYDLEQFYRYIWNIGRTALGYGLDVWGRIVGVDRVLQVAVGNWFGFAEATNLSAQPFGQGAFYSGVPLTESYALTDQAFLLLIFAKAATNITDCSIPAINQVLLKLFPGRGNCYVTDGRNVDGTAWFGFAEAGNAAGFGQAPFGDLMAALPANMTMTYVFDFALQPYEVSIVQSSGALPKPVGVLATATYLT